MSEIYEVPDNLTELFQDVANGDGFASYRIIDYGEGKDMPNSHSMSAFVELVGIQEEAILEDEGTQLILQHPDFDKNIVIDAGGLGDFFSHGFECQWVEEPRMERLERENAIYRGMVRDLDITFNHRIQNEAKTPEVLSELKAFQEIWNGIKGRI